MRKLLLNSTFQFLIVLVFVAPLCGIAGVATHSPNGIVGVAGGLVATLMVCVMSLRASRHEWGEYKRYKRSMSVLLRLSVGLATFGVITAAGSIYLLFELVRRWAELNR